MTSHYAEAFTPLSQRLEKEKVDLIKGLEQLKELIGESNFNQHIETLLSIKKFESTLLVITERELQRSLLLRDFISQIQQAFQVEKVQIISQANVFSQEK